MDYVCVLSIALQFITVGREKEELGRCWEVSGGAPPSGKVCHW